MLFQGALAAGEEATKASVIVGKNLYREYCRSCHGEEAKGAGPVAEYLTVKPSDLTKLSEENEGQFPADEVAKAIRTGKAPGHGSSEMPVWGSAFKKVRGGQTEEEVQKKIASLVGFLKTIQVNEE